MGEALKQETRCVRVLLRLMTRSIRQGGRRLGGVLYHQLVRVLIIAGIFAVTSACGIGSKPPAPDLPPWKVVKDASGAEVRLLEKPPYTYLYALDGKLKQLKYDSNGDQKPDVFAHFSGRDTPDRLEIDSNHDGKLDRWEGYDEKGKLIRFATSSKGGMPERFVELDPATNIATQVEVDADHDGRRERLEIYTAGRLTRSELDTNADGHRDRFQVWGDGRIVSEEIDRDADGKPDIRIVRSKTGAVTKVERLNP